MGGDPGTIGTAVRAAARRLEPAGATRAIESARGALVEELGRVAASYRPRFGSMSVDDVARGRALAHDALAGLQVVPVVNRWARPGVPAVEHSDAFLGTVHTLPPRHAGDVVMRAVRSRWEQSRHMHGPGELAGRTVFTSAQFVPRASIEQHGGDVAAALGELAAGRGSWGVARFGDEARVLDPAVLDRATASARDSGLGLAPARLATLDRMDDVVLERLARSHGFRRDPFVGANDYRIGIDGEAPARVRRESLRRLLHDTPDATAVERLRGYLTGPSMTDIDHMVELQVRGVRGRDVLATVPEAAASRADDVGF